MTKHFESQYEDLLTEIAINAGEKIIDAASLYNTAHSYRSSMALLIVAQEEISKFIILPVANAAGKLQEVANRDNRQGLYFNHRIKQKIFTDFGLQNRSYAELEAIKQGCLYIGLEKDGTSTRCTAKREDTFAELCSAVHLYMKLIPFNILIAHKAPGLDKARSNIQKFAFKIFPAIKDLTPEAINDLSSHMEQHKKRTDKAVDALRKRKSIHSDEGLDPDLRHFLLSNPFMMIDMLSYSLDPEEHTKYFDAVLSDKKGITMDRMLRHLADTSLSHDYPGRQDSNHFNRGRLME